MNWFNQNGVTTLEFHNTHCAEPAKMLNSVALLGMSVVYLFLILKLRSVKSMEYRQCFDFDSHIVR